MSDSDVAVIRAIVREIPAIDWTKADDLTRFARAIIDGLPPGVRLVGPVPPDARLMLVNVGFMETLSDGGRVEWGEPKPGGWYEPVVYTDHGFAVDERLANSRREVTVLEKELAELANKVLQIKPRYEALERVWDWVSTSHATFPEHDHHCPCRDPKDTDGCTCGYAEALGAMAELDRMDAGPDQAFVVPRSAGAS